MSTIYFHKEIFSKGQWRHLANGRIVNPEPGLWATLAKHGDTFKRGYSDITTLNILFLEPICPITHIPVAGLVEVRKRMGAVEFDKMFGYWPWDDITAFTDADTKNELVSQYNIGSARLITFEVK
jgi:hypothetical protein